MDRERSVAQPPVLLKESRGAGGRVLAFGDAVEGGVVHPRFGPDVHVLARIRANSAFLEAEGYLSDADANAVAHRHQHAEHAIVVQHALRDQVFEEEVRVPDEQVVDRPAGGHGRPGPVEQRVLTDAASRGAAIRTC